MEANESAELKELRRQLDELRVLLDAFISSKPLSAAETRAAAKALNDEFGGPSLLSRQSAKASQGAVQSQSDATVKLQVAYQYQNYTYDAMMELERRQATELQHARETILSQASELGQAKATLASQADMIATLKSHTSEPPAPVPARKRSPSLLARICKAALADELPAEESQVKTTQAPCARYDWPEGNNNTLYPHSDRVVDVGSYGSPSFGVEPASWSQDYDVRQARQVEFEKQLDAVLREPPPPPPEGRKWQASSHVAIRAEEIAAYGGAFGIWRPQKPIESQHGPVPPAHSQTPLTAGPPLPLGKARTRTPDYSDDEGFEVVDEKEKVEMVVRDGNVKEEEEEEPSAESPVMMA